MQRAPQGDGLGEQVVGFLAECGEVHAQMVGIAAVSDEQRDEWVDVIDDDDMVVRVATRAEMRAGRLPHRAVSIAVVSSDDRLLVHRRADHKDIWPGRWDIAAGGVVAAGEHYDDAARRELAEELGVELGADRPTCLGEGVYRDSDVSLRCRCYVVRHDGPFRCNDGEVVELRWMTVDDLDRALVGGEPMHFVPDSIAIAWPLVRAVIVGP